jgi:hypothetical protein
MDYFPRIRHRGGVDKNNVESNSHTIIFSMNGEEILSCFYDTALFLEVYTVGKVVKSIDGPGFHLDKDDGPAIQGDKIDFAALGAEIPGYDLKPGSLKIRRSPGFSVSSGGKTPCS